MSYEDKRKLNEKKFPNWEELPGTIRFYQEIYDSTGNIIEVHEKFPVDKGHRKVKRG